jgi:ribonuclease HI
VDARLARQLEVFSEALRLRVVEVRRQYHGNRAAADLITAAVAAASAGDHASAEVLVARAEGLVTPPELRSAIRDGMRGCLAVPPGSGPVTVATDGSAGHEDGIIGWAYVASNGLWGLQARDYRHRAWVHGNVGVLSAELRAVHMALRAISGRVAVLSDSKAALSLLDSWMAGNVRRMPGWYDASWRRGGQKPALVALAATMAARAGELTLEHVRGHHGHPLNEGADRIAGMARRRLAGGGGPPNPAAEAEEIAEAAVKAWQQGGGQPRPAGLPGVSPGK